jgi:hypothetical protein
VATKGNGDTTTVGAAVGVSLGVLALALLGLLVWREKMWRKRSSLLICLNPKESYQASYNNRVHTLFRFQLRFWTLRVL